MLKAYQAGMLSQHEYANGAGVLNAKLTELKSTASGAAQGCLTSVPAWRT